MINRLSDFPKQFAYFKRVLEREKKRRHAGSDNEDDDDEEEKSEDEEMETQETETETKKKSPVKREPKRLRPDGDSAGSDVTPPSSAAASSEMTVTKDQLTKFQSALFAIFEEKHVQQIPIDEVRASVTAKTKFGDAEIMACIEQMSNDNKIMLASDILYLI